MDVFVILNSQTLINVTTGKCFMQNLINNVNHFCISEIGAVGTFMY